MEKIKLSNDKYNINEIISIDLNGIQSEQKLNCKNGKLSEYAQIVNSETDEVLELEKINCSDVIDEIVEMRLVDSHQTLKKNIEYYISFVLENNQVSTTNFSINSNQISKRQSGEKPPEGEGPPPDGPPPDDSQGNNKSGENNSSSTKKPASSSSSNSSKTPSGSQPPPQENITSTTTKIVNKGDGGPPGGGGMFFNYGPYREPTEEYNLVEKSKVGNFVQDNNLNSNEGPRYLVYGLIVLVLGIVIVGITRFSTRRKKIEEGKSNNEPSSDGTSNLPKSTFSQPINATVSFPKFNVNNRTMDMEQPLTVKWEKLNEENANINQNSGNTLYSQSNNMNSVNMNSMNMSNQF